MQNGAHGDLIKQSDDIKVMKKTANERHQEIYIKKKKTEKRKRVQNIIK